MLQRPVCRGREEALKIIATHFFAVLLNFVPCFAVFISFVS